MTTTSNKSSDDSLLVQSKSENVALTQYSEAKRASKEFQKAKAELFKAFAKAELGTWVKKPMEQDEFHIDQTIDTN